MNNYKHWDLQRDKDAILWLGLNRRDAAVNSINEEVLDELNSLLHEISHDKKAMGLIIYSLKEKGLLRVLMLTLFHNLRALHKRLIFCRKDKLYLLGCKLYQFQVSQ